MRKIKLTLENIFASMRLLGKIQFCDLIIKISMTLMGLILPLLLVKCEQKLIESFSRSTNSKNIMLLCFAVIVVLFLQKVMNIVFGLIDNIIMSRLNKNLKECLLQKCRNTQMLYYDDPMFYEKMAVANRMSSDSIQKIVSSSLSFLSYLAQFITYSIILASFYWPLLCLIILTTGTLFFSSKMSKEYEIFNKRRTYLVRRMNYYKDIVTQGHYTKEIKTFQMMPYIAHLYDKSHSDWNAGENMYKEKQSKVSFVVYFIQQIMLFLVPSLCLIFLSKSRQLSIADFTYYGSVIVLCYSAVSSMVSLIVRNSIISERIRDFFDFINMPCELRRGEILSHDNNIELNICLKNVAFSYKNADKYALKNINFSIKSGEKVAVIGVNGSGKTTLIKLLCGLYEPTEGIIEINGKDYKKYDQESLFSLFSVVFQDYTNLELELATSITLGCNNSSRTIDDIWNVLEKVGAGNLRYDKFNDNVFTHIGVHGSSEGTVLSGGESQKIALARAFMQDRPIIIMDEPTAHLDVATEKRVFKLITEEYENKTAIIISHRMNMATMCDRIVLLDNGEIIESGSHEELIQLRGRYYKLFMTQADNYI